MDKATVNVARRTAPSVSSIEPTKSEDKNVSIIDSKEYKISPLNPDNSSSINDHDTFMNDTTPMNISENESTVDNGADNLKSPALLSSSTTESIIINVQGLDASISATNHHQHNTKKEENPDKSEGPYVSNYPSESSKIHPHKQSISKGTSSTVHSSGNGNLNLNKLNSNYTFKDGKFDTEHVKSNSSHEKYSLNDGKEKKWSLYNSVFFRNYTSSIKATEPSNSTTNSTINKIQLHFANSNAQLEPYIRSNNKSDAYDFLIQRDTPSSETQGLIISNIEETMAIVILLSLIHI